jgi:hypothetical protein
MTRLEIGHRIQITYRTGDAVSSSKELLCHVAAETSINSSDKPGALHDVEILSDLIGLRFYPATSQAVNAA